MILNRPHNRLVNENYFSKADKIKFLDFELEEKVAEFKKDNNKYHLVGKKTLTTNTFENQFFKYSVIYLKRKFVLIKNKLLFVYGS
jgi:hypothetical protein